jgi:hypothetical protein
MPASWRAAALGATTEILLDESVDGKKLESV